MTTPKPVGRPPRTRFPEMPRFYLDKRNVKDPREQAIYEALRTRILEVQIKES